MKKIYKLLPKTILIIFTTVLIFYYVYVINKMSFLSSLFDSNNRISENLQYIDDLIIAPITLFTAWLLYTTLKSQNKQYNDSQFKDTLLKLIDNYKSILNSMISRQYIEYSKVEKDLKTNEEKLYIENNKMYGEAKQYTGRSCLSVVYNDIIKNVSSYKKAEILQYYFKYSSCEITDVYYCAKSIIEFIDNENSIENKQFYVDLFKGQITLYELFFIVITSIKLDYEKRFVIIKQKNKCFQR